MGLIRLRNAPKDSDFPLDFLPSGSVHNDRYHDGLPTGASFRNITMKLSAYDASGNLLWENAQDHPGEQDPKAYLAYRLADDKGNPAMPPVATQLGLDSRLKPYEERLLSYDIPAQGVILLRGELYYNLLWPNLVKSFKHLPAELTAPKQIAVSEVRI
jgi:hypothetical protein